MERGKSLFIPHHIRSSESKKPALSLVLLLKFNMKPMFSPEVFLSHPKDGGNHSITNLLQSYLLLIIMKQENFLKDMEIHRILKKIYNFSCRGELAIYWLHKIHFMNFRFPGNFPSSIESFERKGEWIGRHYLRNTPLLLLSWNYIETPVSLVLYNVNYLL